MTYLMCSTRSIGTIVTWWHFLAWSLFMAYSPYLLLTLILIGRCKFRDRKLYLSIALAVFLAPATFGAFSGVVVICFAAFAIAYIVNGLIRREPVRKQFIRGFAFSVAGLLTLWSSIEYVLNILLLPTRFRGYYFSLGSPAGSIQSLFAYESLTTTMWNNFRLVGFLWLAPNRVAAAYPWSEYLPVIVTASGLLPLLLVLGTKYLKPRPVLFPLLGLDLLFLSISTGDNGPFAEVNGFLLHLGGPFLIETNAYDFTMQIYVLTLALIVGLATNELCHWVLTIQSERVHSAGKKSRRARFASFPLTPILAVSLAAIVAGTSSVPFVEANLYTSQGWMADQIHLPQDFNGLSSYFSQNYSGPDFYVAELPLSSNGPVDFQIGNGSFPDSSNLLSKFVPYPLIYSTTTPASIDLDNYLVSPSVKTIVPMLRVEHIKYVIVSPYSNYSAWYMTTAPDGGHVNITKVTSVLENSVGYPRVVDGFKIFEIPHVSPIVDLYTSLPTLSAPNLTSYLKTVSAFESPNVSLVNTIESSIWAGQNSTSSTITVQPISQTSEEETFLPPQTTSFLGSSNGTYVPLQDWGNGSVTEISKSAVLTRPQTLFIPSTANYNTSLQVVSSGWFNPSGVMSYFHPYGSFLLSGSIAVNLTLSYQQLSPLDWTNIFVTSNSTAGPALIQYTIYVDNQGAHLENALYVNGVMLDWGHLDFPVASLLAGPVQFTIAFNSTSIVGAISGKDLAISYPMSLNPLLTPPGGGMNASTNLTGVQLTGEFSTNVSFVYPRVNLRNVSIVRELPYDNIMSVPMALGNLKVEPPTSIDNTGFNFQEHVWGSSNAYLVSFSPGSPYTSVTVRGATVASLQGGPIYTIVHLVNFSTTFSVSFLPAKVLNPIYEIMTGVILLVALVVASTLVSLNRPATTLRKTMKRCCANSRVVALRVRRMVLRCLRILCL